MLQPGGWWAGAPLTVISVILCSISPSPTHAYIYAHYSNVTLLLEDLPALFGSPLPKDGLMGVLVVSHPLNGCAPIAPPPSLLPALEANTTIFIALIKRYECSFDRKVLHAQQAGYSAAIIHNMYSDSLLNMNASNDTIAGEIVIPSVFTSFYASEVLKNFIIPDQGAYVIIKPEFAFPLSYYLIPFTGVVGMIIIVMFVILGIRCVQYRKRLRKNRLSKEQLKRIPIHKFTKGDDYDVCAICLDEYEEGDKLRVLPCSHGSLHLLHQKYEQNLTGPHFGATGAERRMSWYHRALVCTLLVVLLFNVVENEAASFPWSCPSLKGSCRKVCLPTELFFGPLGCGKGFLCCVSHFL